MAKFGSPTTHIEDTVPQVRSALTIVAIDTNLTVLEFIKNTCNQDGIQVLACSDYQSAVIALLERKQHIDLILIEVDMPIMNGYEFLEFLKKEQINVPLIMMTSDDSMSSRVRAIKHGASDYWIKPLHEFHLKNKLTRVFQKKCMIADKLQKDTGCLKDNDKRGRSDNSELASCMVHRSNSNFEEADVVDESCNPPPTKKPRVVWDDRLHASFINAINILGIENAMPKKILEIMNEPGLERSHVASHLQKYRNSLRKEQKKDMSCDPETQIQQQQPQQNDMPLVSGRQIEQPQSEQNDMSWNTEPRMSAVERVHWQPCSATTMKGNMVEEGLANIQMADSFHAEETLAHDQPLASFPNFASKQNFQLGTLDDPSLWKLYSPSDEEIVDDLIMQKINNMNVQQQNDMSFNSGRHIQQQPQQNDMSLVSGGQIEQQQSHQNDMSLSRPSALQPFSATAMTIFHPGFTGNMKEEALAYGHPLAAFPKVAIPENFSEEQSNPNRQLATNFIAEQVLAHDLPLATFPNVAIAVNFSEEQSNPNRQLVNNFIAEQVLAHDLPLATFPNIANNQNSQLGTLDDASLYGSVYSFDTPLVDNPTTLQIDNMQQSMHHNQMYPMNSEPSSTVISGNPAFASQKYNFGMNTGHDSQSIQDGNSIGEGILDQYGSIDSIYHPQFQNAGLPSGAARRFVASNSGSQNPSVDDKSSQK